MTQCSRQCSGLLEQANHTQWAARHALDCSCSGVTVVSLQEAPWQPPLGDGDVGNSNDCLKSKGFSAPCERQHTSEALWTGRDMRGKTARG